MSLIPELIKQGVIEKGQAASLEYEIKTSGKKEEEVLLEKQLLSEKDLFALKSRVLNIPVREVKPEGVSLKILELIPEEAARYYQMIPLAKEDSSVEVGMVYPEDLKAREALNFLARQGKFNYRIFLVTPTTFDNFLKQYKSLRKEVKKALEELETELEEEEEERVDVRPLKQTEMERIVEEAPITKIVAVFLRHAVEGKASDIHIEPLPDKTRVRFRLDGILHSSIFLPEKIHPSVVARVKVLSDLKIDETRVPQDGRFSAKIVGKLIDFRVSTFPTVLGEKVVLRILDPTEGLKDVKQLGLNKRDFNITERAIKRPYGMILATGPTGCGKTTTLYSILNFLNKEGVNITTIEDPVEYYLIGISQSQVRTKIGYDFATGLRHMVRQDPDILMVGEIRDRESADLAINAALTGHLVLSTLHTSNSLGVIPRLIDLGISPFLIPPAVSVAMAQRLVRVLCPSCKTKIKPNPRAKELIMKEIEALPPSFKKEVKIPSSFFIYKPKGCEKCKFTGYAGRAAIFEVLGMTPQLADIILKEPTESRILQEAERQEMITMRQNGVFKVLEGITSLEEVIRETGES